MWWFLLKLMDGKSWIKVRRGNWPFHVQNREKGASEETICLSGLGKTRWT